MEKEIKIKLTKILGSKSPYWQTDTYRIILPKAFVRKYAHLKPKEPITKGCLDEETFIFIETDKGVLIRPLIDFINDPDMKGLTFAPVCGLSLKELAELIDEEAEKG